MDLWKTTLQAVTQLPGSEQLNIQQETRDATLETILVEMFVEGVCQRHAKRFRFCLTFRAHHYLEPLLGYAQHIDLPPWRIHSGSDGYDHDDSAGNGPTGNRTSAFRFSNDWHTHWSRAWRLHLQSLVNKPGIAALEIGSFEGQAAVWMLQEVRYKVSAALGL